MEKLLPIFLPVVGRSLMATRSLRAWVSDVEKGQTGLHVNVGDVGLVLEVWTVGRHVRIRMLTKGVIAMFSHVSDAVWINWLDLVGDSQPSDP